MSVCHSSQSHARSATYCCSSDTQISCTTTLTYELEVPASEQSFSLRSPPPPPPNSFFRVEHLLQRFLFWIPHFTLSLEPILFFKLTTKCQLNVNKWRFYKQTIVLKISVITFGRVWMYQTKYSFTVVTIVFIVYFIQNYSIISFYVQYCVSKFISSVLSTFQ